MTSPPYRRQLRNVARTVSVLSAVMLAMSAWVSIAPNPDAAAAAAIVGAARIVHPSGSPNQGDPLDAGGSDTDFVVELPAGSACSGDSATDGYLVHSYIVRAEVEPGDLDWGPSGPIPEGVGAALLQPLSSTTGSPYAAAFTDIQTGSISGIPVFDFSAYGEQGATVVPEGTFNLGIACLAPAGEGALELDHFWNAQIAVSHDEADLPGGFTWTVVSAQAQTTSLALAVTPDGGAALDEEVTLTATVEPATAVGTVVFLDGEAELGAPVSLVDGVATFSTSDLAAGERTLTALFTPSDEAAFASSSANLQYQIAGTDTQVTLVATPDATASVGTEVQLTATLLPAEATGTVTFKSGEDVLNAEPIAVADGTAAFATSELTGGEHVLTASFDPTAQSAFGPGVSEPIAYTIGPAEVTVVLSADPADSATVGEEVALVATVESATDGAVRFFDGDEQLGDEVALSTEGQASITVDNLAVGDHELVARFEAEDVDVTSSVVAYEIVAASTTSTTTTSTTPDPLSPTSTLPSAVLADSGPPSITGMGSLPLTGGSASIALWGILLIAAGRAAVLLGRPTSGARSARG